MKVRMSVWNGYPHPRKEGRKEGMGEDPLGKRLNPKEGSSSSSSRQAGRLEGWKGSANYPII